MGTYLVTFSISEECLVEADSEATAVYMVREALRKHEYPLNIDTTFIHGKDVDLIKRLPS